MVAVAGLGEVLSGLVVGLFLGLLLGPVLRFWLAWHTWTEASREARLTEDVLERMEAGPWRPLQDLKAGETGHPHGPPHAS